MTSARAETVGQTSRTVRPDNYQYLKIFRDHLGQDLSRVFDGQLIYPRQVEVHLPANGTVPCNFHCFYCQGRDVDQAMGRWEEKGLALMDKLKGAIPYYIYGGVYTEPLMNRHLLDYLKMTKKYRNNFGIHTNGSLFVGLEKRQKFCTTAIDIADSTLDYISVSLDAGTTESHKLTKNLKRDWFSEIIEGLRLLAEIRGAKTSPVLRVCYLMNEYNSSPEEIEGIVTLMRDIKVDSLRFSVPYEVYGKPFEVVERYRESVELPFGAECERRLQPHLSKGFREKPYVFWHPPGYQDVTKMTYRQCVYSYYQITFGADGHVYKCSSTATATFKDNILGEVTDDLATFNQMVLANHNAQWEAATCFQAGARCNRIALEINDAWANGTL